MFQISALAREQFDALFLMDDAALARLGGRRVIADRKPGFPCRVSLADAESGERVVLLPYQHQPAPSPFAASGPIYVREQAQTATPAPGTVPELLRKRLLSVRAYDASDAMVDADVVDGHAVEQVLVTLLRREDVSYLHIHYARPGCYACRVDRV
jgi:hypothetical protein